MKLTLQDKEYLKSIGYEECDFPRIEHAASKTCCEITKGDEKVRRASREKVIRLAGRKKYLAGLSRSVFHKTAAQVLSDGTVIYFDSSRYFM